MKKRGYIISTVLAVIAAIQIFPLIWLILFSLKSDSEIFGGNIIGLPAKFLWQNYAKL